ncbi:hypothetical protein GGR53DRAFT_490690 [Hypoxylon sp. FL1150]|nr:hypothetical protein GGR53DRAFT_490690 [Hypoxylon sp. FL1150]
MRMFAKHDIFRAIPASGFLLSRLSREINIEYALLGRYNNFLIATGVLPSSTPGFIVLTPNFEQFQIPLIELYYPCLLVFFAIPSAQSPTHFGPMTFRSLRMSITRLSG